MPRNRRGYNEELLIDSWKATSPTQNVSNIISVEKKMLVKPMRRILCERSILAVIAALVVVHFARKQLVDI